MRRCLIVANQTLGGEELARAVRQRVAEGPCEFWIVVPATPVIHLEPAYLAVPVMGGMPAVQGTAEETQEQARARLDAGLQQLRGLGAVVDGEVGDADPLRAATDASGRRQFDEIIVSTLPSRISRWLHQDLPHRLEHKLHLPVIHVPSPATPAAPAPEPEPAAPEPAAPEPAAPEAPSAPAGGAPVTAAPPPSSPPPPEP